MKTKISPSQRSLFGGRMRTASILAIGLLAGGAYAQNSSNPDTLQNNSSATDPARSSSYDPATSPNSSASPSSDASSSDRSSSSADSSRRNGDNDSGLKHGDKRFIMKASESTQREIALSQLAATRATNPQVRSYAQQLVSGHQQMEQELVHLAQQKGVTLDDVAALSNSNVAGTSSNPRAATENSISTTRSSTANPAPAADSTHQSMASSSGTAAGSSSVAENSEVTSDRHYRSLSKKSGAEFDKEYVEMMIKEHKSDVKLFQKTATDAKDNDIRAFASRQLPSLQAHLDQANSLGQIAAE